MVGQLVPNRTVSGKHTIRNSGWNRVMQTAWRLARWISGGPFRADRNWPSRLCSIQIEPHLT